MNEREATSRRTKTDPGEDRVLVLAPSGADADALCRALGQAGIKVAPQSTMSAFCAAIRDGAAASVVAEEALSPDARAQLAATLRAQPEWSDFPLIVMESHGEAYGRGWNLLQEAGGAVQAVLLQRPVHTATLLAAVRAALRSRARQYQVRDELAQRRRTEAALRESEGRLRLALDAGGMGIWIVDRDTGRAEIDATLAGLLGLAPGRREVTAEEWNRACHPDDRERVCDALQRAWHDSGGYDLEFRVVGRDDDDVRWIAGKGQLVADGERPRLVGISFDVTPRRRHEEQMDLVLAELNHRVKNTLATLQVVATQTLRQTSSPEAFKDAFLGRIQAIARAHDVLTATSWTGARLTDLIREQLAGYVLPGDEHTSLEGPEVVLSARLALALALVLHELASNATRYGALSSPAGRIEICWQVERERDAERLHLVWAEQGGPKVQPPSRKGFGSTLIEGSLAYSLGGSATLAFEPSGVVATIDVPLE